MKIELNLIPPNKKEEIDRVEKLKLMARAEAALTLILIVFLAMLVSFRYILKLELAAGSVIQKESEKVLQYDKIKNYDDRFEEINSKIAEIAGIKSDQLYWSNLLVKLSEKNSPSISIKEIGTSDYEVALKGVADNRDSLIQFKEKLVSEACFSDINFPLSDLAGKNSIDFEINFNIHRDCLRNK